MIDVRKISIVGLGLIGGSIAKALKSSGEKYSIRALDGKAILERALSDGAIDFQCSSLKECADADVVFICTPVKAAFEIIERLAPIADEKTIISDVCGVKSALQEKWESLNSKALYIGGHPMTGKEKGGYENSDPLLFENAVYILSNVYRADERVVAFSSFIESLGARVMFLDPAAHDEIVANVSHLPQLASVALVNAAAGESGGGNRLDFAAGGFRDMTRIASSKFEIWEEVIKQNKTKILNALDSFVEKLKDVRKLLELDELNSVGELFEQARKRRDEIPRNTKGFLTPLYDVFVFVKDEPGVIFKISSALFKEHINIKDIELLKIREGTGGTFRLSFESQRDAEIARDLLKAVGFKIQK